MIEVFPDLFIGTGNDLIHVDNGNGGIAAGWSVVTAAKEPWHRNLLGYTERAAPKDHPEYLWAEREHRLFLNLVDAPDPAYIREDIISKAIEFIDEAREAGNKVLVHCNQGESRAPTIALLWLRFGPPIVRATMSLLTFEQAASAFTEVYANYKPAEGMRKRAEMIWQEASEKS